MRNEWQREGASTVALADAALRAIVRLCVVCDGLETGGLLLGSNHPPRDWRVAFAMGPGPSAQHRRHSFRWDPAYTLGIMDAVSDLGTVGVIGRWHRHVTPSLYASEEDTKSAGLLLEVLRVSRLLDVIVTCGDDGKPDALVTYIAYDDGRYVRNSLYSIEPNDAAPVGWRQKPRDFLAFLPALGDQSFDVFSGDGELWWINTTTHEVFCRNGNGFRAPSWGELPAAVREYVLASLTKVP